MKTLYFFFTLLLYHSIDAQSWQSFKSNYKEAISLEILGYSPLLSANYHRTILIKKRSFAEVGGGIGLVPLEYNTTLTFPFLANYNIWLNPRKFSIKDCESAPFKQRKDFFLEIGTTIVYNLNLGRDELNDKFYFSPQIGIRFQHLKAFNNIHFLRIHFSPLVGSRVLPFVGLGLGWGH